MTVLVTPGPEGHGRAAGMLAAALTMLIAAATVTANYLAGLEGEPTPLVYRRLGGWLVVVLIVACAAVTGAALSVVTRPATVGWGVTLTAAGTLVPFWAAWSWVPAPARAWSLAAAPALVAGLACVGLGWASQPPVAARRTLRVVLVLVAAACLTSVLSYDPFLDPGCARVCTEVPAVAGALLSTRTAVMVVSLLSVLAALLAAAAIARLHAPGVPLAVKTTVLASLAAAAATTVVTWSSWVHGIPDRLLLVPPVTATALGVTLIVVGVRTWRVRAAVAQLVTRLSEPGNVGKALPGAVRQVLFAVPGGERWVDLDGHDVEHSPPGRNRLVLSDEVGPQLTLLLAERADPTEVLVGMTPAARLALANARLTAIARARLADVQESQRRIVATSDGERRRIERDLHDGAQQRLVGATFHMRATLSQLDQDGAARLAEAEDQVHDALAHLRRLAHGIFPSVLADEGLEAAVEDLAENCPFPVTCTIRLSRPVPPLTAMAAYALVAAALDEVEGSDESVTGRLTVVDDEALTVRVQIEGRPGTVRSPDLTEVADRIGAAGGDLTVADNQDLGYVALAVLPCVS